VPRHRLPIFEAIGSGGWAVHARSQLVGVGARRPRPSGELTESERRTAELAASGFSNKQTARELVVATHTVDVHLSHAYAKLGVRSRAQLAQHLKRPASAAKLEVLRYCGNLRSRPQQLRYACTARLCGCCAGRISAVAVVCVRGPLRKLAGERAEHVLEGASVVELLVALELHYPGVSGWILDERCLIRRHINVFVNGERSCEATAVRSEDRVEVVPAITGG
jgi:DNA-binding CsgD family transcriptional regulator/molybdopterin converting factor small subunit